MAIDKVFTKDELLTSVMIYWVTTSGDPCGLTRFGCSSEVR